MNIFPMGLNLTECSTALKAAQNLPQEQLPRYLADLEECKATAMARLLTPAPAPTQEDYLTAKQAAAKLGCSRDFLYKSDFPFCVRLGGKRLFSAQGIDEYLRRK
jgi:predicted DNA-binding transcriptional regulator AlpA